MKTLKLINGWFRLFIWGVCPECNHDAPKLYDCNICKYYDRYHSITHQKTYYFTEPYIAVLSFFLNASCWSP